MNDVSQEPSGGSLWLSVIGILAGFLLFVGVLYLSYLPKRDATAPVTPVFSAEEMKELDKLAPAERETKLVELRWERKVPTPADRKARLLELRDSEAAALANYSWADKEQGIVRLPVARAMELTLQELQQKPGSR